MQCAHEAQSVAAKLEGTAIRLSSLHAALIAVLGVAVMTSPALAAPRLVSSDPVAAAALASLSPAERADDLQAVRALRRHLYRRLPLASNGDYWITDPPVREAATLQSALKLFETADRGVWCQAAAVLLARLYEAAGYRAWVTSFGDPATLTHTVTLVEVDGVIYLQDAYFNLDYVRRDGRPLPYFEALQSLAARRAPRVRQDLDFRLGIFPDPRVAREWTPPGLHGDIVCVNRTAPYLCNVALTSARFAEVFYIRDKVKAFLRSQGEPEAFDYLMLHPLWTSTARNPLVTATSISIQARAETVSKSAKARSRGGGAGRGR